MRIKRSGIFSLLILCMGCAASSAAASEEVQDAVPGVIVSMADMPEANASDNAVSEVVVSTADMPEAVISRPGAEIARILSPEELESLAGTLPRRLFSGSRALNRLNGFSLPDVTSSMIVEANDRYMIVRPSWQSFEQDITETLAKYQGDWSVYIKDLRTGETMEINEHAMESASLIKLYIAGAIYEQIDEGHISEDSVSSSLDAMITVSDNESANVLVRKLMDADAGFQSGLDKVNDFIDRHGFENTQQVNGIADPSLWIGDGINETSTADCGRLLEMIYDHTLVSHYNCYRFESLLNRQQVNYKIPSGLPESVHISHKTGEVSDTENDAAIIYTPYGDYIFCIMSTNLTDTGSAVEHIRSVTATVYDYFTGHVVCENPTEADLAEYLPEEPYILYRIEESDE